MAGLLTDEEMIDRMYGPNADTPTSEIYRLLGLNPNLRRGTILPIARNEQGGLEAAVPQSLIDLARAFRLPARAMGGGSYGTEDIANFALNTGALGAVGTKPAGALASGAARTSKPSALPMDEASRMARALTEDDFIKHHKTGRIPDDAYERYSRDGGLSFLGGPKVEPLAELPKNYVPVIDRARDGSPKYFMWDQSERGWSRGRELFDTEDEARKATLSLLNEQRGVGRSKQELYPEVLAPIKGTNGKTYEVRRSGDGAVVFDGDTPIGLSSNEFGTAGVWVSGSHQKQGIGSELLARFMKDHPGMKIGQMTAAGEAMSRATYRKLRAQDAAMALPAGGTAPTGALATGAARRAALPMDEASRMARAAEQGFDVETPLYHGTNFNIEQFAVNPGFAGRGVYASKDPEYASAYARPSFGTAPSGSVYPLVARGPIASEDDVQSVYGMLKRGGKDWNQDAVNAALAERGFSGRVGRLGDDVLIFDPKNIRSRFAAFDPAKKDSADLLAGVIGLPGGSFLTGLNQERSKRGISKLPK